MRCTNCDLPLPSDQGAQTCPLCFTTNRPEPETPAEPDPSLDSDSEPDIEINDDEPESE